MKEEEENKKSLLLNKLIDITNLESLFSKNKI